MSWPTRASGAFGKGVHCQGQAMIEGLLVLGVLVILFWAVAWVGRQLDLVQHLAHASRHAVFVDAIAPGAAPPAAEVLTDFWLVGRLAGAAGHAAAAPGAGLVLPGSVQWGLAQSPLSARAQPGGTLPSAQALRRDWALEDPGLRQRTAEVRLRELSFARSGVIAALRPAAATNPGGITLRRSTVLAAGAGASVDDTDTTRRLAQGEAGWAAAATASREVGQQLQSGLQPLEGGWGRAAPQWDWLGKWQHLRPDPHSFTRGTSGGGGW